MEEKSNILVTGAAGFIGAAVSKKLCQLGYNVIGIDNINNYYDVNLKYHRLDDLLTMDNFTFIKKDISYDMTSFFKKYNFDIIIHLAAQAGVRYSITNPESYIMSNLVGFGNILEGCRKQKCKLLFASSSSVYGMNEKTPYSEDDVVDNPISLYAATKKSNELMAHSYSHLYNLTTIGLRFFTVYGPMGRPDMAPMLFANAIANEKPIKVFNYGDLMRDFTYIDDIVNGIIKIMNSDIEGYEIFNIGKGNPDKLMDFIKILELEIGKESIKEFLPMQDGDVYITYADTTKLKNKVGYEPKVSLKEGIHNFIEWYKKYNNI